MNTKIEGLYVLIREDDLTKLNNFSSDCFSLVPELGRKFCINMRYPNPIETYKASKKQLLISEKIIKKIYKIVNNEIPQKEKLSTEEVLKPFLDAKISIYLYLNECIPEYNTYNLFVDGKWKKFNSKTNLIIGLENEYLKEEGNNINLLGKFTKSNYSFLHNYKCDCYIFHKNLLNKYRKEYLFEKYNDRYKLSDKNKECLLELKHILELN